MVHGLLLLKDVKMFDKALNSNIILIRQDEQLKQVIDYMLENKISFQVGLEPEEAIDLAEALDSWEPSEEFTWINSGC